LSLTLKRQCSAGISIYESGNLRGSFGAYAAGDRLKVAVEGGVVKYYRNATLLYTSTVPAMYPLQVDSSLNTVGAGVYNVVISAARLTASPVNYVLQDVQGSTRALMSATSVIARHDFLPFGEELGAGTGMRTSGQGFGATDKIRQRYAMTERDDSTGLDHTWWRKYENRSGRWTTPDPYRGSMTIANPQSFNGYAYVQNDPVNFVDPSGLWSSITGVIWLDGGGFIVTYAADGGLGPGDSGFGPGFGGYGGKYTMAGGTGSDQIRYLWGYESNREGGSRSTLLWFAFQDPLKDPFKIQQGYDMKEIFRRVREREKARRLNNQAWADYAACVSKDPATKAYYDAHQKGSMKAALPIPSLPGVGKVGYRTARGASLVSRSNIFTLVFSGMLHILFSNPDEGLEDLRDKADAVEKSCKEQTKQQYGFVPRGYQPP